MARRRLQLHGHLYEDGRWWRLRWWEDAVQPDGTTKRVRPPSAIIGPCEGPGKMTKTQAKKEAWENILRHVNAQAICGGSLATLNQFVTQRFQPEVVDGLKHAGQLHYGYCFSKILPALGDVKLRDLAVAPNHPNLVQQLISSMRERYSVQTQRHIRNAVHAVIEHAKRAGQFVGENPASLVKIHGEQAARPRTALDWTQARYLIESLESPEREAAFLGMTVSMNVAELCGLRWRRVNLTDAYVQCDAEIVPPFSALVRENWYRGHAGTVKKNARNRTVPLPAAAVQMLKQLRRASPFAGAEDFVFACSTGRPIDAHNVNNRQFKRIGKALGVKITWHVLRHTCATLAEGVGMVQSDRKALLGHAADSMTAHYTHEVVARMRAGVEEISARILGTGTVTGVVQ